MTDWPSDLPDEVLRDGYSETIVDRTIRTANDAGPENSRPRYTSTMTDFTVSQFLTSAEVAILLTFHDTTLEGGSLSFDWIHPRTLAPATFKFKSPPRLTPTEWDDWHMAYDLRLIP